jgi:hypothetical protein
VLRAGGRFAFTVWDTPDAAVGLGIVLRAVQTHGDMNVPLPPGPPFFRFSDRDESGRALVAAGFAEPTIVHLKPWWLLPSPEALFSAFAEGSVRTRALLLGQSATALKAIHAAVVEAAAPYVHGDHLKIPMGCVLAAATRP